VVSYITRRHNPEDLDLVSNLTHKANGLNQMLFVINTYYIIQSARY